MRPPTRQPPRVARAVSCRHGRALPDRPTPRPRGAGLLLRPPGRHTPLIVRVVPPDVLPPSGGGGDGDPALVVAGLALAALGAFVIIRVLLWDYVPRPTRGEDAGPTSRLDTRLGPPPDDAAPAPRALRPAGLAAALTASAAAVASSRSLSSIREAKAIVSEAGFDADVEAAAASAAGVEDPSTLAATSAARRAQMVAVAAAALARGCSPAAARRAAVTRVAALAMERETQELLRSAKVF